MNKKITAAQVKVVRLRLAAEQGNRCSICGAPFSTKAPMDPVLDHDHATGAVRAVLHRGCNSLLGKVENNAGRYGVRNLRAFTNGVAAYLSTHMVNVTGYIHPTYRTEDEKRLLRNKRARISRAKAKKEQA